MRTESLSVSVTRWKRCLWLQLSMRGKAGKSRKSKEAFSERAKEPNRGEEDLILQLGVFFFPNSQINY